MESNDEPEWLRPLLKRSYGRKWDIQKDHTNGDLDILIHFPKIQIENSKGQKHEIQDLYVKLRMYKMINAGEWGFNWIKGARTTYTLEEYKSGYVHSHLPSGMPDPDEEYIFEDFCLGGGATPISQIITELQVEKVTEERLEILFLQLNTFLAWESLEGGPYIKMETIGVGTTYDFYDDLERVWNKLIRKVTIDGVFIPTTYKIEGNTALIIKVEEQDPDYQKLVADQCKIKGILSPSGDFIVPLDFAYLLKVYLRDVHPTKRMKGIKTFKFKGKSLRFRVLRPKGNFEPLGQALVSNPRILKEVTERLNSKFKKYCYEKQEQIQECGTSYEEQDFHHQQKQSRGYRNLL